MKLKNCINNLFSIDDPVHSLIEVDLKELLKFASYEYFSHLITNIIAYEIFAMEFLQGLANAFLCHFQKQWLSD